MKEERQRRIAFKINARRVLKRHYFLLLMLCLVSMFFGSEFGFVKAHMRDNYNLLTGRDPEGTGIVINIDGKPLLEEALDKIGIDTSSLKDNKLAEDREEVRKSGSQELKRVKGGTRGFLSRVFAYLESGDIVDALVDAGASIFHSKSIATALLIIAGLLVHMFIWLFLKNVYIAMLRRMFLEAREYKKLVFSHVLFFRMVGRYKKAAYSMLRISVYKLLWWLTIVGGPIKHYSYLLAPYIVAENPDIDGKTALSLSSRMMDGHKMEAFRVDLSFLGWYLLGIISFGISEAFWSVPYRTAVFSEFYAYVRDEAKWDSLEDTDLLNDDCLFVPAEREVLENAYSDIEEHRKFVEENQVELEPVNAFFARNFGLWLGSSKDKKRHDEVDRIRQQIEESLEVIDGKIYPLRLHPLWKADSQEVVRSANYLRTYTVLSLIMIFFIFSFVGWIWEVSLHLVKDGVFVNRGVLHGPWLPVYGSGVTAITVLLAKWRSIPYKEAFYTMILCGFLEYMTSYWLEVTKGMRWWDYTGYILNLNGRICAEGLIVFVAGGMAAVYVLVPLIDTTLSRLNTAKLTVLAAVLVVTFAVDMVYSHYVPNTGEGITDYSAYKESCLLTDHQYDNKKRYRKERI